MIDVNTAWSLIKQNAQKAFQTQMVWHSLVQHSSYSVNSIAENTIIINRADGGAPQPLTCNTVENAIIRFNDSNGHIQRRHLISPTVAEETALVLFHPNLGWSEDGDFIIELN